MTLALLFPGQGSQAVGMGKDLYEADPAAKAWFDQADQALGRPLSKVIFEGPEEALKETANTQPALYVTSLALLSALGPASVSASYFAGHSLGEYSALAAAGVLTPLDGLKLVQARADAMSDAARANAGTMAAILGLDDDKVIAACREAEIAGPVQAANFNSPGQVVISGSVPGVEKAMELAKAAGALKCVPLAVSGPFHSVFMRNAGESLRQAFAGVQWHLAKAPVVANVDARLVTQVTEIQERLVNQVSGAVQWAQSMRVLRELGVTRFVEVGPGKVLAGLMKKIDRSAEVINVFDAQSVRAARELLGA